MIFCSLKDRQRSSISSFLIGPFTPYCSLKKLKRSNDLLLTQNTTIAWINGLFLQIDFFLDNQFQWNYYTRDGKGGYFRGRQIDLLQLFAMSYRNASIVFMFRSVSMAYPFSPSMHGKQKYREVCAMKIRMVSNYLAISFLETIIPCSVPGDVRLCFCTEVVVQFSTACYL